MKNVEKEIEVCNRVIDFYSEYYNQRGAINRVAISQMKNKIKILESKL